MSRPPALRHDLGLVALTMASLGGIIGSGWLFGALRGAQTAGPASILSWVIGGAAVALIGLVYAELSAMIPETGGPVRFPQYSHGTLVSLLMGWSAWVAWAAVPAIEAEAAVQYAGTYLPGVFDVQHDTLTSSGIALAAILLLGFFMLNYFGVQLLARVNIALTLLKALVPAITVVAFLSLLHRSNFRSPGGFAPHGAGGVVHAITDAGVIFSFMGFRQAIDLAGEARAPQRDVPRAIFLAIGIAVVLYLLLEVAFLGAVAPADLAGGWSALRMDAPFVQIARTSGLSWLVALLLASAVLAPAGTGLLYMGTNARVAYALTENGYFPRAFSRIHATHRVPHVALVANFAVGLLFLLPFPSWSRLVSIVSDGVVLTYMAGPVSALALRRTAPHASRPIRIRGLHLIAPSAFVISGLIVYWSGWPTTGQVVALSLSGLGFYAYYAPRRHFPRAHVRAALWLITYLGFLAGISYLGGAGGIGLVSTRTATLLVVLGGLIACYWGERSAIVTEEVRLLTAT